MNPFEQSTSPRRGQAPVPPSDPEVDLNGEDLLAGFDDGEPTGGTQAEHLYEENIELKKKLVELERQLHDARGTAKFWSEQQKDFESLLEEKSEVIRQLHLKLQEQSAAPSRPAAALPREEELLALHEELEQERRQLKEDEGALMQQMRDMEVQLSRERAELARQRNELQRLHREIKHELELAAREASLRERLQPLQRRHQELSHRKGEAPRDTPVPGPAPKTESPRPTQSGIFRRLFGQGE